MPYNSTIRQKVGPCCICGFVGPLTKEMCQIHYWQGIKLKSVNKVSDRDVKVPDELQDLIDKADDVFSQWLRLSQADEYGYVTCYTCDSRGPWQQYQCGHYIKRDNKFLRWDTRNTRVQDKKCNEYMGGHYTEYTHRLEAERPGITEILLEEGNLIYKPSRDEIRSIITEYTKKLNQLKK